MHRFRRKNFLTAVGAPESILHFSHKLWQNGRAIPLNKSRRLELESEFSKLSREGFRVLGFAFNPQADADTTLATLPPLTLGGFFAMKDPLREGVRDAVATAARAGIRVVMITGDHKLTAHAIAKEAGIAEHEDGVMTGEELDTLSDTELLPRLHSVRVFARVSPHHKLRIIELFRKRGEVVAMTGDGVNDAPSLAAADLGVAMGTIGTEVAKEAADVVLLDDRFENIIAAAEEGRSIYKTIKKVILYLFSTSLGEVLVIVGAIIFGLPLPMTPAQIIWLNFITDGFLVVALAMEPKESNLLTNALDKPRRYVVDAPLLLGTIYMGTIIGVGTLFAFMDYLPTDPTKAFTMALTVLAVFQWFNAWNCKSEIKSIFTPEFAKNKFLIGATGIVIILQMLALYHPFFQSFLHTVPLSARDWLVVTLFASSILVIEELRKLIVRAWHRPRITSFPIYEATK
ncbi:MAG: cation-transporting P-type ATPase [Candidatus Liptonbacteria bacterium]|nr:cation-transporting P-type ATPase [Candidatus Liptonbacteria bacterium]